MNLTFTLAMSLRLPLIRPHARRRLVLRRSLSLSLSDWTACTRLGVLALASGAHFFRPTGSISEPRQKSERVSLVCAKPLLYCKQVARPLDWHANDRSAASIWCKCTSKQFPVASNGSLTASATYKSPEETDSSCLLRNRPSGHSIDPFGLAPDVREHNGSVAHLTCVCFEFGERTNAHNGHNDQRSSCQSVSCESRA